MEYYENAKNNNRILTAYVISSNGCTGQDQAHFSSEGCRKLGKRYAIKMLSLMGYNSVEEEQQSI